MLEMASIANPGILSNKNVFSMNTIEIIFLGISECLRSFLVSSPYVAIRDTNNNSAPNSSRGRDFNRNAEMHKMRALFSFTIYGVSSSGAAAIKLARYMLAYLTALNDC